MATKERAARNPYIAGSPVTGPDMFVGREDIFAFVEQTLHGMHADNLVVLHGQRRVGKTSVLYQLRRRLDGEHVFALLDLQTFAMDGLSGFLWELATQLARHAKRDGIVVDVPDRSAFRRDPQGVFGEDFLPMLLAGFRDRRLVLMIDEADRIFQSVQAGQLEPITYSYLRHVMQHTPGLGFVLSLTGDVEDMIRQYAGLFTASCCRSVSFLSRDATEALILQPVKACYALTPAAVERIVRTTSGHPYYVQLLCHSLFNLWLQHPADRLDTPDIEKAEVLAVELGAANLQYIWDEADRYERIVLSAMAGIVSEPDDRAVSVLSIQSYCESHAIRIRDGECQGAIRRLLAREVIAGDSQFHFTVGLLRRWVLRHRHLEVVRDQLVSPTRPDPITMRTVVDDMASDVDSSVSIESPPSLADSGVTTPTRRVWSRIWSALVDVPPMPAVDPTSALMARPAVPEERRFCAECGATVGRTRNGKPGRVHGFCSRCRLPFSFVPALKRGDLVAEQYRVAGCLAYGGLGWIYLADDERVSNRWVVLKGLVNTKDPGAMEAALAERRFLARVEHPNVVRIYNFVQDAGATYIVMEYVGGQTLKDVLKERRRADRGPLPLELAIAYILAILPAFAHLHSLSLIYNDFKPDNMMLHSDDVKLIDLGAVTRLGDPNGVVYGTEGYQAPEVATAGPSIASDLYTIGRCLAMLALDLPGYQSTYKHRLPGPATEPLLARHESFHRFLLKATAARPQDRFQSADDMAEQLHGVLREVVVLNEGTSHPVVSNLFGGDLQALYQDSESLRPDWHHLPSVRVNASDPAATLVLNAMILDPERQVAALKEAIELGQAQATGEAGLGLARALIEIGDYPGAEECLHQIESVTGRDWRVTWYRAISLLVQGRAAEAQRLFDYLYSELSGELAPKLALASAAELAGDLDTAGRLYEVVAATDASFTSACFGLARVRRMQGDRAAAVNAYQLIPRTSRLYTLAQLSMARVLNEPDGERPPSVDDLARASTAVARLSLDPGQRAQLTVEILSSALELIEKRLAPPSDAMLLGAPFQEGPVRLVLEQAYRDLARLANGDEKIWLVDQANRVRPPVDDFSPRTLDLEIVIRIKRSLNETSIIRLAEDLSDQTYRPISPIILVGRQDCDITLPDPALSRKHAEIVKIGDKWAIRDLGSTNGTRVNGEALAKGVLCYVGPGDLIELGSFFDLSVSR